MDILGDHPYDVLTKGNVSYLNKDDGLKAAKQNLVKFARNLSDEFMVSILIDIPTDIKFDPRNMIKLPSSSWRPYPLPTQWSVKPFKQPEYQTQLEEEFLRMFSGENITLLTPTSIICPNSICNPIAQVGTRFIKIEDMRPWYVLEKMDFIDQTLAKK